MGPESWLRSFLVFPEHPFKNQARVPTVCARDTRRRQAMGLLEKIQRPPGGTDSAQVPQHSIPNCLQTGLCEPGETEG